MEFSLRVIRSDHLSGIPSECQTVCIQIRPDIWVQSACKDHQHVTLEGKELTWLGSFACTFDDDQDQHFVRTDLGPNYLLWLSADHTKKENLIISP